MEQTYLLVVIFSGKALQRANSWKNIMKSQAINPSNVYKICRVLKLLNKIYSQKIRQKENLLFLASQFGSPNEMWGEGQSPDNF